MKALPIAPTPPAPKAGRLRRALNFLYDASAALAALMLVMTLLMVLAGMAQRYLPWHFYGSDAYAGYCMAASGFLALAHTLKKGEHIRVTLLLNALRPPHQAYLERFSLLLGTLLAGLFCYFSVFHTWQSWALHDISTGTDATPLWIPQLGMALGSVVFLIAVLDELLLELTDSRHGANGADGSDGSDGSDGADGADHADHVEALHHE